MRVLLYLRVHNTQNTKSFVEIILANDIQFNKFRPDVQFRPAKFMVLSSMWLNSSCKAPQLTRSLLCALLPMIWLCVEVLGGGNRGVGSLRWFVWPTCSPIPRLHMVRHPEMLTSDPGCINYFGHTRCSWGGVLWVDGGFWVDGVLWVDEVLSGWGALRGWAFPSELLNVLCSAATARLVYLLFEWSDPTSTDFTQE